MNRPERIFLTGSNGIVGRHVATALRAQHPQCDLICNTADLTNLTETTETLKAAGPLDLIIHLAALVPVDDVINNPALGYAVNAGGTINLLSALASCERETGVSARMLYCSSSHVYAPQAEPIREDAPTTPTSVYGKTKLMGEEAARSICSETERSLCVARLFSIHDPAQTGSYLRPALTKRFADADPAKVFELYGAGSLRDFLPAKTAAQHLVDLAFSSFNGVVNVGSGKAQTVAEFAQSLAPFPLNIKPIGTDNALVPDVSLLKSLLGEVND